MKTGDPESLWIMRIAEYWHFRFYKRGVTKVSNFKFVDSKEAVQTRRPFSNKLLTSLSSTSTVKEKRIFLSRFRLTTSQECGTVFRRYSKNTCITIAHIEIRLFRARCPNLIFHTVFDIRPFSQNFHGNIVIKRANNYYKIQQHE